MRRLVAEHVYSVEQLEVLLLVRSEPARDWTPGDVSGALYTQPDSTARWLDDLVGRGLVVRGDAGGYRYAVPAAQEPVFEELADCYARRRVSMIALIFADRPARGADPVQSFADAFRIRDEDEEEE